MIDALKNKYKLKELLGSLKLSKSSYFYQKSRLLKEDKYSQLREDITDIFNENYKTYGYRRIYLSLKNKGIVVSEKVNKKDYETEWTYCISTKTEEIFFIYE